MRLLAGTALSMLLNTAPQPESGARAALALFQLVDRGVCYDGTGKSLSKGTERGQDTHRQSEFCCCVHFQGPPSGWMVEFGSLSHLMQPFSSRCRGAESWGADGGGSQHPRVRWAGEAGAEQGTADMLPCGHPLQPAGGQHLPGMRAYSRVRAPHPAVGVWGKVTTDTATCSESHSKS